MFKRYRKETIPVIGYKNYGLNADGSALKSKFREGVEIKAVDRAACPFPFPPIFHRTPVSHCSCGFYSVNYNYAKTMQPERKLKSYSFKIWCQVEHWGKTEVCTNGYWAEYQRILSFLLEDVTECESCFHRFPLDELFLTDREFKFGYCWSCQNCLSRNDASSIYPLSEMSLRLGIPRVTSFS